MDDGLARLVIRRHDLSGCDYEGVLTMPRMVADEIDRRGKAVRVEDSIRGIGNPGIVVIRRDDADSVVEVRADLADPTTVVASTEVDAVSAACCVHDDPVDVNWILKPGS
jgi:hypothetical protein